MDSLIEPSSRTGLSPDTISISNVNLSLGTGAARVHILKDISLRVTQGEAIGLIGPSGSGKSTLLMVMAGLERPDSGEVVVGGTPFNALDEDALARFRGRQVGIVFQSFHLIPTMTALENVAVPLELAGHDGAFEGIGHAHQLKRHGDILQRRHGWDQVEALEHHAHPAQPETGQRILAHAGDVGASHDHAPGCRLLKACRHHQKRGLAGAGGAGERNGLAYTDVQ